MIPVTEQKMITAILPKGKAFPLAKLLIEEHGLTTVDMHYARGVGRITPLRHRGIGETSEREILTVTIDSKQAEKYFDLIYHRAEINRPHGGLMYMQSLPKATQFTLPDIPEEK